MADKLDLCTLVPQANIRRLLRETTASRDKCQCFRESVHNSADAGAKDIWIAPLVSSSIAGYLVVDNGEGMSRPVGISSQTKRHVDGKVSSSVCYAC